MAKKSAPGKAQRRKSESHKLLPLKYPYWFLAGLVVVVYAASIGFGYTKLDDTIFIQDFREYNSHFGNLFTSFTRGVFDATKDTYYRPLFLDSMIINNAFSGQNVHGYHLVNVLLHLGVVLLLLKFLLKVGMTEMTAFLLSAVFAIHPVLVQNVVWIPGRNDTLLALFVLLFLLKSIEYCNSQRLSALAWSFLWLICAFFTKETAVFAPVTAFLIQTLVLKSGWKSRTHFMQYGSWVLAFLIWYGARAMATVVAPEMQPGSLLVESLHRLPLLVQYIGKILLPFNLSPFPIMEDTVYYYGVASLVLFAVLLYFAKPRDWKTVIAGVLIFLSFLIPVFLVPTAINTQTFEHRLYLPMLGILLILSQTVLFQNTWPAKKILTAGAIVIIALTTLNILHQQHFTDEISFWKQAVKTSPHSAYAIMMLGAKLEDPNEGAKLFRQAYALDSTEKYINYYYGAMLQYQDSILESEKYLLKEKERSDYVECDYMLARVAAEKNNIPQAIEYLENFLARAPLHELGNTNLLQLYVQSGDYVKARLQMLNMDQKGLPVSQEMRNLLQ